MARRSNWSYNFPRVIQFLKSNPYYEYEVMDPKTRQHLRIIGMTTIIDLWPAQMTYHVIEGERPHNNRYRRLNYWFKPNELKRVLEESYP